MQTLSNSSPTYLSEAQSEASDRGNGRMFSRAAKNRHSPAPTLRPWHTTRGPRWPVITVGSICFLLASSCGGPKIPEIKGRLPVFPAKGSLQTDDGKPLSEAKLVFHPVHELPADASKFLPR